MRNSLSARLVVRALAVVLGVAVPVLTCGQEKNDRSTATNTAERSDVVVSRSESGSVPAAAGSTQPAPLPSATSSNWTGGYIGGHFGWGTGRADTTFTPLPTAAQFVDMAPTTLRPDPSGLSGGAQGGYNWQTGHFVVGGEADFSWSRMSGTATVTPIIKNNGTPFPGVGFLTAHQDTKWFGTVRLRAGAAFGRVFLYGTGGLAYGHVNYSANSDFRPVGPPGPFRYPASLSKTKTGWTVGGGGEVRINQHWSWKAEYLYYDLGNLSFTANPVPANPPFQVAYRWETKAHTFNTGVNFRF